MRVKITEVSDRNDGHITQGHGALNLEGELILRADNRMLIPDGDGLLTSAIDEITIKTRNSVYVLEVIQ